MSLCWQLSCCSCCRGCRAPQRRRQGGGCQHVNPRAAVTAHAGGDWEPAAAVPGRGWARLAVAGAQPGGCTTGTRQGQITPSSASSEFVWLQQEPGLTVAGSSLSSTRTSRCLQGSLHGLLLLPQERIAELALPVKGASTAYSWNTHVICTLHECLQERVAELEREALADKSWHLVGEVTGQHRPMNSALELDMEFENTGGWGGACVLGFSWCTCIRVQGGKCVAVGPMNSALELDMEFENTGEWGGACVLACMCVRVREGCAWGWDAWCEVELDMEIENTSEWGVQAPVQSHRVIHNRTLTGGTST